MNIMPFLRLAFCAFARHKSEALASEKRNCCPGDDTIVDRSNDSTVRCNSALREAY